MNKNVVALFITYNPVLETLILSLNSVKLQVAAIVVVDNGSDNAIEIKKYCNELSISYISNKNNIGIASATNQGVESVLCSFPDADYILLSDQDTLYPCTYIQDAFISIEQIDCDDICAFSPNVFDSVTGVFKKLYIIKNGLVYREHLKNNCQEVFQAIASGMLIKTNCFNYFPKMKDELFIDWVDFEWCWHVRHLGFRIMALKSLVIKHAIGDENKKRLNISSIHSPLRNFYIVRNGIYLSLYSDYLSMGVRWQNFIKSTAYMFIFLINDMRLINAKMLLKGFLRGLLSRLGKYD